MKSSRTRLNLESLDDRIVLSTVSSPDFSAPPPPTDPGPAGRVVGGGDDSELDLGQPSPASTGATILGLLGGGSGAGYVAIGQALDDAGPTPESSGPDGGGLDEAEWAYLGALILAQTDRRPPADSGIMTLEGRPDEVVEIVALPFDGNSPDEGIRDMGGPLFGYEWPWSENAAWTLSGSMIGDAGGYVVGTVVFTVKGAADGLTESIILFPPPFALHTGFEQRYALGRIGGNVAGMVLGVAMMEVGAGAAAVGGTAELLTVGVATPVAVPVAGAGVLTAVAGGVVFVGGGYHFMHNIRNFPDGGGGGGGVGGGAGPTPQPQLGLKPPGPGNGHRLKSPDSKPFTPDVTPGDYVFVRDKDGIVHILKETDSHLHALVLGGKEVASGAGGIKVGPGGKILEIDNASGTFQFGAEILLQVKAALQNQGANVEGVILKAFQH